MEVVIEKGRKQLDSQKWVGRVGWFGDFDNISSANNFVIVCFVSTFKCQTSRLQA